jgi:hypothetical protein
MYKIRILSGEVMGNTILEAVYVFNNTERITELRVPADSIEQINGWILAIWNGSVVGGVKEEYLKAFYLTPSR